MTMRKKYHRIVMAVLAAVLLLVGVSGCGEKVQKEKIEWQLYGAWISADGSLGNQVSLSVRGAYPAQLTAGQGVEAEIAVEWPENFQYRDGKLTTCHSYPLEDDGKGESVYLLFSGTDYDPEENKPVTYRCWLFPEKELVVFVWGEESIVVASTDPNADLAALYESVQHVDFGWE